MCYRFYQYVGLLIIVLFGFMPIQGQHLEAGLQGGVAVYQGDLSPDNFLNNFRATRPALGAFVRYNPLDMLSVRIGFTYAQLHGDDALSDRARNLNFDSDILEGSLTAEWNVLGYQPYGLYRVFSPYIFGGIAFFNFNPTTEFQGETVELQPLGTEGQGSANFPGRGEPYNLTEWAIPFGVGVKYAINDKWNIGLEAGMRYTFTDYLDDVSTTYVNFEDLAQANGELSALLSNRSGQPVSTGDVRGNPDVNDWYFITTLFISYNFLDNGLVGSRGYNRRKKGCY